MSKKRHPKDSLRVRGFFRLNIIEETAEGPRVVGDSGWVKNLITNAGYDQFLCRLLAATTNSLQVGRMALGTGGAPAATDTSLAGELTNHSAYSRQTPAVTVNSSKTVQFTATFASSVVTANANISNIGLVNATASAGTLMAGNTFTSSTLATNQSVNATYQIQFS